MKKLLRLLLFLLAFGALTGGYFVFERFRKNVEQIVPYPYEFSEKAPLITPEAPIVIIGDRMAHYFARFSSELATVISVNLAKPIKIQSMAREGQGLHRTLHELRSLTQWPQILVYQGGSEEFSEKKFDPSEIRRIRNNFERQKDDRLETAIIVYPPLSRLIYEPVKRIRLGLAPDLLSNVSQEDYLARLDTELLLYEQELQELVTLAKDRNSLLILMTTPLNYDVTPKRFCDFSSTPDLEAEIRELSELKEADPKGAYKKSSVLIKQFAGNALLFHLHGQIAKKVGEIEEAKTAMKQATAFDCSPWRSTEVFNSIIRRVASANQVILFDFAKLVEEDWNEGVTFLDETHPQNLYYEKGMEQLGLLIREILKL